MTPAAFLRLDDEQLLAIGFSRQKARYVRLLAARLVDGSLDLEPWTHSTTTMRERRFCELTGVGAWTADVYLLMVLRRPDVWPVGDVALQTAAVAVKGLPTRPDVIAMEALAEPWRRGGRSPRVCSGTTTWDAAADPEIGLPRRPRPGAIES